MSRYRETSRCVGEIMRSVGHSLWSDEEDTSFDEEVPADDGEPFDYQKTGCLGADRFIISSHANAPCN
ncbi:hypothetical protein [Sporosarcina aquimarina]|uniref:hypothetical protein n=1 Tax=Sporosarcina aquimarina TaxID=114975 RepID=UPI00295EDA0D|nr:hypothetical protein [Sporosarcina aquimarina]